MAKQRIGKKTDADISISGVARSQPKAPPLLVELLLDELLALVLAALLQLPPADPRLSSTAHRFRSQAKLHRSIRCTLPEVSIAKDI